MNITKNTKYDGCQRGLVSMVYNFFVNTGSDVSGFANKSALKKKLLKNYANQLLEAFKKEKFVLESKTTFVLLI